MTLDWRQARIAQNEASFRDINERLERDLRKTRGADRFDFVCECGDRCCDKFVSISVDEYEGVRRDSRRFAVVPGHVFLETERVVARNERYEVVEKFGEAENVADASDRRSPGVDGLRDA